MKSLRLIALSALLTVGAFSTVLYTSCSKDACSGVTCQNGGTCSGGNCTCPTGYEGTNCETKSITKFAKNWIATDKETSPKDTTIGPYAVIITQGTTVTDAVISNTFSESFFTNSIKATISGNTITIPSQAPDGDNYTVSGSGTYDATTSQITWTYSLTNPSNATISYKGTWQ